MNKHKRLFLALSSAMLALSLFMLIRNHLSAKAEQQAFEALKSTVTQSVVDTPNKDISGFKPTSINTASPEESESPYIILYEENSDFAGWLTVDQTNIDYPVMYTPNAPEYYLRRGFDKNYSLSGTPFLGAGCDLDSDCAIIYGHNMKNGTMFGTLARYKDEDFWRGAGTMTLNTLDGPRKYEVFSAVYCRVLDVDEEGFRYYDHSGTLSEEDYQALTDWLTANACYDTGVVPAYGEQILILSTCSYHTQDGRFIVAARRID